MNPINGIKRMFGPNGLVELIKSLFKVGLLGGITFGVIYYNIKDKKIWHNLSHSRKQINNQLAKESYINRWPSQKWDAILKNPITGEKSIYIASHSYQIEGMSELNSQKIITEVINFCTQDEFVYSHSWSLGDVLIWDERSILHRGRPWPYEEPRTMASICVSVGKNDGFKI